MTRPPRIAVVDALRGVAVLAMIEWHTADAWLAGDTRGGFPMVVARAVGGLAAPWFFLLAGVSLALATPLRPSSDHSLTSVRRGLRVVLAGYALSLFSWLVDHGAPLEQRNLGTALTASLAVATAALALDDRERRDGERAALALTALGAAALTSHQLDDATRAAAALLPRLDVLHGIGAALIATALALHAARALAPATRALALGTAASLVAAAAVSVRGAPQHWLPGDVAAWIARDVERGGGFPLFPWVAYALLGAALGLTIRARPQPLAHRWALPFTARPGRVALLALGVAVLAWDYSPVAHALLEPLDAIRSLTRLIANASLALAVGAALAALAPRVPRAADALALLGRHSLVLYAAHLELAYGLAGIPLQRTLGLGGWLGSLALVVVAMHALASEIERRERERRARSAPRVEAPR